MSIQSALNAFIGTTVGGAAVVTGAIKRKREMANKASGSPQAPLNPAPAEEIVPEKTVETEAAVPKASTEPAPAGKTVEAESAAPRSDLRREEAVKKTVSRQKDLIQSKMDILAGLIERKDLLSAKKRGQLKEIHGILKKKGGVDDE